MVELRSSFDLDHLPEVHHGLSLLVHHVVCHQTGHARVFEVVYRLPLVDPLAWVLGHPYLDPTLARLFDVLNTCPLFLSPDSRDWRNRCLLRNHVEMSDGEVNGTFFDRLDRLDLFLVLSPDRGHCGGHLCLLLSPAQHILEMLTIARGPIT